MTEWLPIESAPKDGTYVLLYDGTIQEDGKMYTSFEVCHWLENGTYGEPGWFHCCDEFVFDNPTHWMPLPKPKNKYCTNQNWAVTHQKDGIYACHVFSDCGFKSVNFCPICGEKSK